MNISKTPGATKKLGKTRWEFQATFQTPLKKLDPFVSTILSANDVLESASVTIDEVVFEPKHLNALRDKNQTEPIGLDVTFVAEGREQAKELLVATFSDWVDFFFVPAPKPFVIYADHDEYATFFANTKSKLNSVVEPLLKSGFKQVLNYQRQF